MSSNYDGYEAAGSAVRAFVKGFHAYPTVLQRYLDRHGLGFLKTVADEAALRETWTPLQPWVEVTHALVDEIGPNTMYGVGRKIAETIVLPPQVDNAVALLNAMNMFYHSQIRRDGVLMFDPATGTMLDGIGNFWYSPVEESSGILETDNPFPCDYDRGIIVGAMGLLEPAVSVTHADNACRKKGDATCKYLIQW